MALPEMQDAAAVRSSPLALVHGCGIDAGNPAHLIRPRFPAAVVRRMQPLKWWDWPHERLRQALPDFRKLSAEAFLDKYESQIALQPRLAVIR